MLGPRWIQKPPVGVPIDPSHPLARGLLAFWALAEGTGLPADLVSGAVASSNTATWTGSPGYGPALSFNGTSQYVAARMTAGLRITSPYSVAAAVLVPSGSTTNGFILDVRDPTFNGYAFYLDGSGHFTLTSTTGGTGVSLTSTATVNDGRWHVLAGSQATTTTGGAALYLDGQPSITGAIGQWPATPTSATPTIGARSYGAARFLQGSVALVAVWSRALSAGEHAALAASPWQVFRPQSDAARLNAAASGRRVSYPGGSSALLPLHLSTVDLYGHLD